MLGYHTFIQVHNAVVLPAEQNIKTDNQENINQMLQQFNFTCKAFTTAMAIKNQLQYSLFDDSYYFNESNGALAKVRSKDGIRNLTTTLEYIETIASSLQNIQVYISLCMVI